MSRVLSRVLIAVLVAIVVLPAVAGEGRTPIYAWVTNITQPGKYIVTRHIMPLICSAAPIDIQASDVDIDLNGFAVSACPGHPVIHVAGQDNITIRNGTLWLADFGVLAVAGPGGNQKIVIEDVKMKEMFVGGIELYDYYDFAIRRNQIWSAGDPSMSTAAIWIHGSLVPPYHGTIVGNHIQDSIGGIHVRNGSAVAIRDNRLERISIATPPPVQGALVYDISAAGLISNNTIREVFDGSGIYLGDSSGTKIYNNVVRQTDKHGIELGGISEDNFVLDNVVTRAAIDGLHVEGNRNHIDRNLLNSNGAFGLHFIQGALENNYGRNSGVGNGGPAAACASPFTNDFCDDNGFPPGPPNWSFGDNLMPGGAGIF